MKAKQHITLFVAIILLPIVLHAGDYPIRNWTVHGQDPVQARYAATHGPVVVLEAPNRRRITVRGSKLSPEDLKYLASVSGTPSDLRLKSTVILSDASSTKSDGIAETSESTSPDNHPNQNTTAQSSAKEAAVSAIVNKVKSTRDGFEYDDGYIKVTTFQDKELTAEVTYLLQIFLQRFQQTVGLAFSFRRPIDVIVYSDKDDYQRHARKLDMRKKSGGMCHRERSSTGQILRWVLMMHARDGKIGSVARTLLHEATHAAIQQIAGGDMASKYSWLNEGMAEYFEEWDFSRPGKPKGFTAADIEAKNERRARSGLAGRIARASRELRYNGALPSSHIMSRDYRRFHAGNERTHNYALAEAFVDCLLTDPELTRYFDWFILKSLSKTSPRVDMSNKDLDFIEERWQAYLKNTLSLQVSQPR